MISTLNKVKLELICHIKCFREGRALGTSYYSVRSEKIPYCPLDIISDALVKETLAKLA